MKRILLILCGLLAFSAYSQVTLSEEDFKKLPKEVQQQIRPDSTVIEKLEETSKAVSIGREIGTAVNETLTAVSDNVIRVAESNVGQTAIGIAMWKLLWKDILGIVAGTVLFGFSMYFGMRAIKKPAEDDNEDDVEVRRIISGIAMAVLFISSMCCAFG